MELSNLSPEIQEKISACNSPEEILALAKEEGYALSEEELEQISGGKSWVTTVVDRYQCPKCGSFDISVEPLCVPEYKCKSCGWGWDE